MIDTKKIHNYAGEIKQKLLLRTDPIAIRLLKDKKDIPKAAIRPLKDLGTHIALCQAFAMSRRENVTVAMLKEDHWCYAPVISLGLAEPPKIYLSGEMSYPDRISTLKAARRLAKTAPRIETGKYIGTLSSPLKTTIYVPDLVIIYCNVAQLRGILLATKYKDGYQVTSTLEPGGACIQSTVPLMLTGDCQVTVPCGGDYKYALAQEDEIIFSIPTNRIDDLMLGMRNAVNTSYADYHQTMKFEYSLPKNYIKAGKSVGMGIHD